MKTETFKKGFTLAELLTAIAIIAILIGILLPALNMARKFANDTKQKAMLSTIETGIIMFKNDNGEYPRSTDAYSSATAPSKYCGSQILAECMLGQDLLGFHPSSIYDPDAWKSSGSELYYDPNDTNLRNRKGPYLNRENIGVFKPKDIFDTASFSLLIEPENYLICDVYTAVSKTITLPDGRPSTNKFKMGTPILYFRANTSYLDISASSTYDKRIYNFRDNQFLVAQGKITNTGVTSDKFHENFIKGNGKADGFYDYITDETATTTSGSNPRTRPVRPDSFLLISAGADGLYGTTDDICNFTPNIQ